MDNRLKAMALALAGAVVAGPAAATYHEVGDAGDLIGDEAASLTQFDASAFRYNWRHALCNGHDERCHQNTHNRHAHPLPPLKDQSNVPFGPIPPTSTDESGAVFWDSQANNIIAINEINGDPLSPLTFTINVEPGTQAIITAPQALPEPGTLALLGLSFCLAGLTVRRCP